MPRPPRCVVAGPHARLVGPRRDRHRTTPGSTCGWRPGYFRPDARQHRRWDDPRMPDVASAAREDRPGRVPGASLSARPRAALALLREAIAGDPAAGLAGPRGPLLAVLVTGFYVLAVAGLAHRDVAVPFAIVPLVVAALTLTPRLGTAVAIVTFATVAIAETLVPDHGFGPVELVELIAFAIVSLALRLVVFRLARGRDETTRTAAELASIARPGRRGARGHRALGGPAGGRPASGRPDGRPALGAGCRGGGRRRDPGDRRLSRLPGLCPRGARRPGPDRGRR